MRVARPMFSIHRSRALPLVLLLIVGPPATGQQTAPGAAATSEAVSTEEAERWRSDLAFLAEQLTTVHKDAFFRTPRSGFEREVRRLYERIPHYARHQIVAGLQRVVASLHDGHTSLLLGAHGVDYHYLPVELYAFREGLFITAAAPEHASLAGARVVRIGNATAEAAIDSAGNYVSHENRQWVLQNAPGLLRLPELLHAMGLTDSPERASFTVERGGRTWTELLRPHGPFAANPHGGRAIDTRGWVRAVDYEGNAGPLRYRRPGDLFWAEYLADSGTLYVAYRAIVPEHGGESNAAFFRRVFALADSLQPARVVLDLRDNHGGNSFHNREVVRSLIQRPWLDHSDRFFALIGRGTFSAAQNLVNDLEYYTNATLVGEPTGNSPNMFGDHEMVRLPNSGLVVGISTRWHQGPRGDTDRRSFTTPRVFVEPAFADYEAGRDAALATVIACGSAPPLGARLAEALAAGDTALASRLFYEHRQAPANRYANVEGEVNTAGYQLLSAGRVEDAVYVFRLNTAAYPESANTHDSLGEALERAGRRDEAAESYRRALALDPDFSTSREGLRRVGG